MNKLIFLVIGILLVSGVFYYTKYVAVQKPITPEVVEAYDGAQGYVNDQRSVRALLDDPNVETSIDVDEVLSGGVPKDGIPSIEMPRVVLSVDAPTWILPEGDGIAVTVGKTHRFYPYQVLVNHEIVNDQIEDTPVLVTYCPLCYTGIVFDPVLEGKRTAFGVSGTLWNSNLLMYNRSIPESLWSQAAGEAVIGPLTGTVLEVLPFDITTFGAFVAEYPESEIVIGDAKSPRIYGGDAYGGDLRNPNIRFDSTGEQDTRLAPTDIVMGINIDGNARAYHVQAVEKAGEFTEEFAGRTLKVMFITDIGAMRVYDVTDGAEERLNPFPSFWFSWASTHPETSLYK